VLRTDLRVRAGRLRLAQGRDLDRAFVEDQIFSHEDARNLQDMMMNEQGGNPKLAALAREGFDLVNANLVQLRELQQRMMMAK
jgi:predicted outer membrane protein